MLQHYHMQISSRKVIFMEPIDTDFDYVARQSREADPRARFNWLYMLPVVGILWVVYLSLAVIFEWPLSNIVDQVMMLSVLFFLVIVGLLFWAVAPRATQSH